MKTREMKTSGRCAGVRWTRSVTVPIRDMERDGRIAFCVTVYGVTVSDLAVIGGDIGSLPLIHAVKRMGLDIYRYQASLFDLL